MRKYMFMLVAAFALIFLAPAPKADAQISIGIGIAGPSCPYGYYGYGSYNCAPYGYYGPEWFVGGRFIGAGRYYHGPAFYGHVNRSFDPRFGYHGGYPARGPYQEHPDHFQSFQGSHYSDTRGHYHTEDQHQAYVHGDRR